MMAGDWFEQLFGFEERSYDETKRNLEVVGTTLRSQVNRRSYAIGQLETPSLQELRQRALKAVPLLLGKLKVANLAGDVRAMHRDPANCGAMFQVASQFNLLEMVGPNVTPEDGVTRIPALCWKSFATLVLEGAYEATLWAAVANAQRFSSKTLFLTQLGGGAFGNETAWIHDAMRRALQQVANVDLDVRLVSYGGPDRGLQRLADEFN